MTDLWAAYAAAFVLGATHALEVDHMVAMTAVVGSRPRLRAALQFGLKWGLGHAVAVLAVGTGLAATGLSVPPHLAGGLEFAVGAMMIAIGIWALRSASRLHLHDPQTHAANGPHPHAHLHSHHPSVHPHDHSHAQAGSRHRHLPTLIGAVHGLAGSAAVIVLVPVTLIDQVGAAVGYLSMFGIGTVLAMMTYSALAAVALGRAKTVDMLRVIGRATAVASFGVGVWWIVRGVAGQ